MSTTKASKPSAPGRIGRQFALSLLPVDARLKTALLINPPVYDTQY